MDVPTQLVTAVGEASKRLAAELCRHGVCEMLVQDVMRSAAAWLPACGTAALKNLLVPSQSQRPQEPQSLQLPGLRLSGEQTDAAFATLRMLHKRLSALSSMAHEPSSCSSAAGISVNAQSWLVARKPRQQHNLYQYGYSLTLANTAEEPLQLMRKAWTVQDMTGSSRHRESWGLCGLQPVIEPSSSLCCKTAITLSSIKGSMQGYFELRGLVTGACIRAQVPAFALTPSALQQAQAEDLAAPDCGVLRLATAIAQ